MRGLDDGHVGIIDGKYVYHGKKRGKWVSIPTTAEFYREVNRMIKETERKVKELEEEEIRGI